MADIQFRQPGGMAQKTKTTGPILGFRSFTSMTAKLLVGVILIGTIGGCATTGHKLPKSYINNNLEGKFKQNGSVSSPTGSEAKYGVDGSGRNVVIVTDGKEANLYTSTRTVKKIKYDKKTGQYKIYYTDGTVDYTTTSPK
jgi:hypothetical protein